LSPLHRGTLGVTARRRPAHRRMARPGPERTPPSASWGTHAREPWRSWGPGP